MEEQLKKINEKLDIIIALLNNINQYGVPKRDYTITINPDIYYPKNSDPPNCTGAVVWPQPEPSHIP